MSDIGKPESVKPPERPWETEYQGVQIPEDHTGEFGPEPYVIPDDDPFGFPPGPIEEPLTPRPSLVGPTKGKGRRLVKPSKTPRVSLTGQQRLLLFDTWRRSRLPANDFAALAGAGRGPLSAW